MASVKTKMVEKVVQTDVMQKFIIVEDNDNICLIDEDVAERLGVTSKTNLPSNIGWFHYATLVIRKSDKAITKSRWF